MTSIARTMLFAMILVSMIVFYFEGIDKFPDYENYLVIAENAGFISEGDYLFEWFSRFVLGLQTVASEAKVELLALLNQVGCLIYFVWLADEKKPERVFGGLLLFCLLGFMFMTTTLRASLAYLCVSAFFVRGGKFDLLGVVLLVISLAWHDSAAPVILICLLARLGVAFLKQEIEQGVLGVSIPVGLIAISVLAVLFGESLRPALIALSDFDVGARSAYFDSDGAYGLAKMLFILLAMAAAFGFVQDSEQSGHAKLFSAMLCLLVSFFYLINGTIAVRFVFFVFAVTLPLRGVVAGGLEKQEIGRWVTLLMAPVVFYLSINYIFMNSEG